MDSSLIISIVTIVAVIFFAAGYGANWFIHRQPRNEKGQFIPKQKKDE